MTYRRQELPPIVRAAQSASVYEAADAYSMLGMSVLPLIGKRPALATWTSLQTFSASFLTIDNWARQGLFQNVGIICGAISGNLAVLNLDGPASYCAFADAFPHLTATYTVATGGGVGQHLYFYTERLPRSLRAMDTPIGNLELCASGRLVVAPPSIHQVIVNVYRVEKPLDILRVAHLNEVAAWIESFRQRNPFPDWQPPQLVPVPNHERPNPRLLEVISRSLLCQDYQLQGDWVYGSCLHPERHRNGDRHPSFGFNRITGDRHCYICGPLGVVDISAILNIDPARHGGLFEEPAPPDRDDCSRKGESDQ